MRLSFQSTLTAVSSLLPSWKTPEARPRPRSKTDETWKLKFTGDCSQAEFEQRCQEQAYWYHSFYFDNGFVQRGEYDIGRDVAGYGFPSYLRGMSVLDIGTGSGWFAAYFEQRGAEVVTVDVRGSCDLDLFGRPGFEVCQTAPDRVLPDGREVHYGAGGRAFWIMKELLGLKAEFVNARIYDICPALFGGRKFDLVFAGSMLNHLRDPIGALSALRSVCKDRLIATSVQLTQQDKDPLPLMALIAPQSHPYCWWQPNRACVLQWLRGAGFEKVTVDRDMKLSVDQPWLDDQGKTFAFDQTQYLIHAWV